MEVRIAGSSWFCEKCGGRNREGIFLYQESDGVFNAHSKRFGPWCSKCGKRVVYSESRDVQEPETQARPEVLLISGTCSSGKSAISYELSERHGYVQIDGNWIWTMRKSEVDMKIEPDDIHGDMLVMADGITSMGVPVVIAHIVVPSFFSLYQAFLTNRGIPHRFVVLMPREQVLMQRHSERKCWPGTMPDCVVRKFYNEFLGADEYVKAYFYDNSEETVEKTASVLSRQVVDTEVM